MVKIATDCPAIGQVRVTNDLYKQAIVISPARVRCVLLRHGLETLEKRLKALEAMVSHDDLILSESRITAPKRRRFHKTIQDKFYAIAF